MDDNGLGNIIFYIILAVIGLIGSFTGKKKASKTGKPAKTFSWPDLEGEVTHSFPDVFDAESSKPPVAAAETVKKKTYIPAEPSFEGRYEEPMAGNYSGEGSYTNTFAERYSAEGSMSDELASRFSGEGSYESMIASAFRNEGVSSLDDTQIKTTFHDASEEEGGIIGYDYNVTDHGDSENDFDLRKAVIYSALLNRKEYSF